MMFKPQFKRRWLFQKRGGWIALGIIILAYIISAYWYQFTLIQGESMYPSFYDKQLVLLDKHSRGYKANDVIAFYCEELKMNLVKRIVAVPGDSVMIADGVLYVNGERNFSNQALGIIEYGGIAEQEIILKDGQFFVLGDNVAESKDSRYAEIGIVYEKDIIGKVIMR